MVSPVNNKNKNDNKKKSGKQPQQGFCRTQDAFYLICFILVIQNLNLLIVKKDPFELYSSSSSSSSSTNILQETTVANNNNKAQREKSRDLKKRKRGRGAVNTSSRGSSTIDPYTPTLLTVADAVRRREDNDDDRKLIHIVKSRFMQYQPELEALGWARYWQFKFFCLPAMAQQTSQDFIWVIYTDPDLQPDLLQAMVELLEPYPNYYLIKSLEKKLWKGGQPEELTETTVYSGNQEQLEIAMALREELPILETRLDADDAVPAGYFEEIQRQATSYFVTQEEKVDWMYWCVNATLEWTWLGNQGLDKEQQEYGVLGSSRSYSNFCPTPGMTLGYSANTTVKSIYTCSHSQLIENLLTTKKDSEDFCGVGRKGPDCYQIVDKFDYPAFRSRTPTSASMVITDYTEKKLKKLVDMGYDTKWDALDQDFGITRSHTRKVNYHVTRNIVDIANESLMGQCTQGHSCRDKAKEKLNLVLETYAKRDR